ncbi:MAG: tRNA (adenosine(37)-N6)-threonylcarbamoyltransferase complex dimerization subunit type 1 TsaB [Chthoniobacterales bacterium]
MTVAFELSSGVGSVAWCGSGLEEPFLVRFPNDRKHSGVFFQNLQASLKRFGRPDRVVVGLGPGSYAGTRIAIATATGLAAATGARLSGTASLRAMETDASEYIVIGDARRNAFFFARMLGRRCIDGPLLAEAPELGERLQGSACPIFTSESLTAFPVAEVRHPSALILAELNEDMTEQAAQSLEPIYLRAPHITYPKVVG